MGIISAYKKIGRIEKLTIPFTLGIIAWQLTGPIDVLRAYSINDIFESLAFSLGATAVGEMFLQQSKKYRNRSSNFLYTSFISSLSVSLYAMKLELQQLFDKQEFLSKHPDPSDKMMSDFYSNHGYFSELDLMSYPIGSLLAFMLCYLIVKWEKESAKNSIS